MVVTILPERTPRSNLADENVIDIALVTKWIADSKTGK
jgi:hypothetical protein